MVVWSIEARSRFDPPFQNEMHPPQSENAEVAKLLNSCCDGKAGKPHVQGLVHGHFLGDGREAVIVAAITHVQGGYSPSTLLLSNGSTGWKLQLEDKSETVAYCQVIFVNSRKDILLCQSLFVGPAGGYGKGKVDSNLYTMDFTRDPPRSDEFLHIEDTVTTGARCLSWANVKSVDRNGGGLRVAVEYGRRELPASEKAQEEFKKRAMHSRGSPSGFPTRVLALDFRVTEAGVEIDDGSKQQYEYVTAKWLSRQGEGCSAESRNEPSRQ